MERVEDFVNPIPSYHDIFSLLTEKYCFDEPNSLAEIIYDFDQYYDFNTHRVFTDYHKAIYYINIVDPANKKSKKYLNIEPKDYDIYETLKYAHKLYRENYIKYFRRYIKRKFNKTIIPTKRYYIATSMIRKIQNTKPKNLPLKIWKKKIFVKGLKFLEGHNQIIYAPLAKDECKLITLPEPLIEKILKESGFGKEEEHAFLSCLVYTIFEEKETQGDDGYNQYYETYYNESYY